MFLIRDGITFGLLDKIINGNQNVLFATFGSKKRPTTYTAILSKDVSMFNCFIGTLLMVFGLLTDAHWVATLSTPCFYVIMAVNPRITFSDFHHS